MWHDNHSGVDSEVVLTLGSTATNSSLENSLGTIRERSSPGSKQVCLATLRTVAVLLFVVHVELTLTPLLRYLKEQHSPSYAAGQSEHQH